MKNVFWLWRLPVIRHVRYGWNCWLFNRHMDRCRSIGLGFIAQQSDLDYLDGILKGRN
jgi:hypothetical protein